MQERASLLVELFTPTGERVMVAADGEFESGLQALSLDLSMLTAGAYICRVRAGQETITRLIVVE